METNFDSKVEILAQVWDDYTLEDESWTEFVQLHNIGLPLAYCLREDLATPTEEGRDWIEAVFQFLLDLLKIEDIGFFSLDAMLKVAAK